VIFATTSILLLLWYYIIGSTNHLQWQYGRQIDKQLKLLLKSRITPYFRVFLDIAVHAELYDKLHQMEEAQKSTWVEKER
jgi:hypothetical protein